MTRAQYMTVLVNEPDVLSGERSTHCNPPRRKSALSHQLWAPEEDAEVADCMGSWVGQFGGDKSLEVEDRSRVQWVGMGGTREAL